MQLFADLTFCPIVGVHLRTFKVLHGYFFLGKTSEPTTKTAGSEIFDIDLLSYCLGRSSFFESPEQEDLPFEVTAETVLRYRLMLRG